jgi:serine phosphatase RsbU (regulator of sigma subunit)
LLVGDTPGGLFVTAIFAVLDLQSGELIYANAGHNLPLLFTPGNHTIQDLSKGEMALGVMENIEYQNHSILVKPDDILLFYTDGLTETFSKNGELFGLDQTKDTFMNCSKDSSQVVLSCFNDELTRFRDGYPPSDDLTMIVIKRAK